MRHRIKNSLLILLQPCVAHTLYSGVITCTMHLLQEAVLLIISRVPGVSQLVGLHIHGCLATTCHVVVLCLSGSMLFYIHTGFIPWHS